MTARLASTARRATARAAPLAALLLGPFCALGAQAARPAQSAVGIGWSPAAGLAGVEYVRRPTAPAGRLPVGFAVGAGLAGVGGRVQVGLGGGVRTPGARRVPYAGVSGTALVGSLVAPGTLASVEAGVQFWPRPGRRAYFDVGGGAAVLARRGHRTSGGPVLRAIVGVAF